MHISSCNSREKIRIFVYPSHVLGVLSMRKINSVGDERGVGGGARRAGRRGRDTGMAAEAGRETRRGAESDEESDGCNEAQDSARVHVRVRNTQ